ncbi:hypothetical protein STRAU_4855 [Streptomyces aurantiacus JA 4570]|uniref:Uncharacterized protein n=1 Tax=Streptomyces aurantiacus JA 4570 TaxID=1286094 RepID=S4AKX3_9ACTN|nr:hypothetical protein STRAU_4855 [Streptomyces aurantiacus JA 4570]
MAGPGPLITPSPTGSRTARHPMYPHPWTVGGTSVSGPVCPPMT